MKKILLVVVILVGLLFQTPIVKRNSIQHALIYPSVTQSGYQYHFTLNFEVALGLKVIGQFTTATGLSYQDKPGFILHFVNSLIDNAYIVYKISHV